MVPAMVKVLLRGGLAVLLVGAVAAMWFLIPAHLQIRGTRPPLPPLGTIRAEVAAAADGPVRLSWINTASQATPRRNVLGAGDPHPQRPYRLCHSSFVLEWRDGRTLLVDAGMTRAQAESFGAAGEWAGGEPAQVLTTVAGELRGRGQRADGVVFTHLHVDHVDGVRELCDAGSEHRLAVSMTPNQARLHNYTTAAAFATLQSLPCADLVELPDDEIAELPGFPGVFVIRAAGHTPGSQVVVAALRRGGRPTPVVFSGDVVNHIDGINLDLGKPALYRALVVPEDDRRLGEVRRLIRSLRDEAGFEILVSHDEMALEASAIARYPGGGGQS
jgi:glyoxylase-like metal-dependent hydrolase (beta-lactamase superfamily II)